MPHKADHHPIATLRRECDNIAFLSKGTNGVGARLRYALRAIDALETERNLLKQRWAEKHQAHNMATLRIAYLERMLEISQENNDAMRQRIIDLSTVPPPVWRSN